MGFLGHPDGPEARTLQKPTGTDVFLICRSCPGDSMAAYGSELSRLVDELNRSTTATKTGENASIDRLLVGRRAPRCFGHHFGRRISQ